MTDDPRDLALDELEVSVRSGMLLADLPARTLGELLGLPTITGPRRLLDELRELFEELEVQYEGELVPDEAPVELIPATGSVAERWTTIRDWLEEEHPDRLEGFRAPASLAQVTAAEEALGLRLPDDYREFVQLANGQEDDEPMVWTCTLLPVEALAERREGLSALYGEGDATNSAELNPAIRPIQYSERWIPIGVSARGRDFLCLDLDPAAEGKAGQVILIATDDDQHQWLAGSFADFLSMYFEDAQNGEVDLLF